MSQKTNAQWVEEGSAFEGLSRAGRETAGTEDPFDVIVIGGGQSGLSVGYHLARRRLRFLILDANERVGDTWRRRWDSLRLFTTARFDGLVGMPFPAPRDSFPTKDEMADYLESYAKHFELPVSGGMRVERLSREDGIYVVRAGGREFRAAQVVVAMATYQKGRIPAFAAELDSGIRQLHSSDYRNPGQLHPGGVLLVGAGNSGAEIALDVARTNGGGDPAFSRSPVYLSGRDVGHVPFRIDRPFTKRVLAPFLFRVVFHRLLTLDTPLGRKARPAVVSKGALLIRVRPEELAAAWVERVPRVAGVRNGRPLLEDGRVLEVANVVWATGFHQGLDWIDLPLEKDEQGDPVHTRGVVASMPGLYFVGIHFLYAFSSTMIHGAARDAEHVAREIARRAGGARRMTNSPSESRIARSGGRVAAGAAQTWMRTL